MIMKRQLAENLSRAEIQDLGLKWSISSLLTGFHFVQRKTLPPSSLKSAENPQGKWFGENSQPLVISTMHACHRSFLVHRNQS